MAKVMKRILFALLLVAGLFVLSARACEQPKHAGTAVPHADSMRESIIHTVFQASGKIFESHRCDCPALGDCDVSAVFEPRKTPSAEDIERSSDFFESSFVESTQFLEAHGRYLSTSAPPGVFPLYLLTARLRC